MRYAVGADHAGITLKRALVDHLRALGADVDDLGPFSGESVDYPDFAGKVANAVLSGAAERGLLICGTGVGMAIAANKVPGIRAAVVSDPFSARMAVAHNDAQVLCVGSRVVGEGLALLLVDAFHAARFEGGRHQRRVDKIRAIEEGVAPGDP